MVEAGGKVAVIPDVFSVRVDLVMRHKASSQIFSQPVLGKEAGGGEKTHSGIMGSAGK